VVLALRSSCFNRTTAGGRSIGTVLVRRMAGFVLGQPRQYPDFGWAWLTRFLSSLAIDMGTLYRLYFMRDEVHYAEEVPRPGPPRRACSS